MQQLQRNGGESDDNIKWQDINYIPLFDISVYKQTFNELLMHMGDEKINISLL